MDASELFSVKGLVAVITGGGSGLGLIMAKALEANGAAKVFIAGRNMEKLEKAAKQGIHGNIIPVQCDVTSKDSLVALAAKIKEDVGYVNPNAGCASAGQLLFDISPASPLPEISSFLLSRPWEAYTEQFNVHVTATLYTCVAFLELLDAGNKKGNISWSTSPPFLFPLY
ncbi:hypothetical protein G7Y89_g5898 [Cudoniella acicularis]|uniref:Uncharacterized protein n=1 Tax=Cudoniella acicularis TaxID=354080 RepID=A0A8H4RLK0_9HELO|nr:hypothetical protein G7Y89_g5898 [Cudoniella acicularis]